jgi:hypothetical protein
MNGLFPSNFVFESDTQESYRDRAPTEEFMKEEESMEQSEEEERKRSEPLKKQKFSSLSGVA